MNSANISALISCRIQQAEESLAAARLMFENELYQSALNRSYYAMFYAVLAIMAKHKKETSKHTGVISYFDREMVKTGFFDKEFSRWLHEAFDLRQLSDYKADFSVSIEESTACLKHAETFLETVKNKINTL